jgi:hypothetical protein
MSHVGRKSAIPVLRNENGALREEPYMKVELLQKQYQRVFSDPTKADISGRLNNPGISQGLNRSFCEVSFIIDDIVEAVGNWTPTLPGLTEISQQR